MSDVTPVSKSNIVSSMMDELIPAIDFNYGEFLSHYYKINNENDFFEWLQNNQSSPILTKNRIILCAFQEFAHTLTLTNNILTETLYMILKKVHANLCYARFHKYVTIIDKNIDLINPTDNTLEPKDFRNERFSFIFQKIVTIENVDGAVNSWFSLIQQTIPKDENKKYTIDNIDKELPEKLLDFIENKIINNLR